MPEFPREYKKYISENLQYPAEAKKSGIQGNVTVKFLILESGNIDSVSVVHTISPSFDSEAIRLIKIMPPWKPGRNDDNIPIKVWFTIQVPFKIN